MRSSALLACCLALVGCGAPATSPTQLETETTASPVGDWIDDAARLASADLVTLQILADGRFARIRCLDDGCDRWVPEDGHWLVSRRTIRFYLGGGNFTGTYTPDPKALLDTWTFSVSRGRLTLTRYGRKLTLDGTTDAALCGDSGGTFAAGACDCGAGYIFVAGEGGCVTAPTPSEALCDASGGSWTDDDNILLGTFCECPLDQSWVDGTGCAAQ
jgi:hypothetical protein